MLNKDNTFVINLLERTDRLNNVTNNLKKYNYNFTRFDAIKHEEGYIGCGLSHIKCLEIAKEQNLDYIFIIEDDAVLECDKDILNDLICNFLKNDKLDALMIISNIIETPIKYDKMFYYKTNIRSATFYCVKKHFYDTLINFYKSQLENKNPIDRFINITLKSMIVTPIIYIGTQRPSYSNIENRYVKYTKGFNRFKLKKLNS